MSAPDLQGAATVVDVANDVVTGAARLLASHGSIDDHQVLAYDLAHAAAGSSWPVRSSTTGPGARSRAASHARSSPTRCTTS